MASDIMIKSMVIPRGRKGLPAISINLEQISQIEDRIPDIARSNPLTIADLITQFNVGILQLARAISLIESELKDAQQVLREAEAYCILDKAEDVLRSKNLKSTADLRSAVVDIDPDVVEARAKVNTLTVMSEYMSARLKAIEKAYHGAKKICDIYVKTPSSPNYAGGE